MRGEAVRWVGRGLGFAVGFGIAVGLVLLAWAAAPVLALVFVAILLASALEPAIGWLRLHLPLGRPATILLVYTAFLAAVVAIALVIVPAAAGQLADFAQAIPPFLASVRTRAAQVEPATLSAGLIALIDSATGQLQRLSTPPAEAVVKAGLTVAEVIGSVVALLAVVFFWLVEHARLQRYVLSFLPDERRPGVREAWNEVETRLGLWVRGQLLLMTTIGVATGVAYTLMGLPSALLLGLLAGLAEGIPIVGPLLGAIPALLVALTIGPEQALIVAGVYVILQAIEGNILVPLVMRNTIGLSPFVVLVSLLVGASAGGLAGAFLAVPIAAVVEVVLERLQDRDVPVAQEPSLVSEPETQTDSAPRPRRRGRRHARPRTRLGHGLPDSAGGAASR
jgi:predicted PurR-regulated permease PerM